MLPNVSEPTDFESGFSMLNRIFTSSGGDGYVDSILGLFISKVDLETIGQLPFPDRATICRRIINQFLEEMIKKYIPEQVEFFLLDEEYELFPLQLLFYEKKKHEFPDKRKDLIRRSSSKLNVSEVEFLEKAQFYFEQLGYDFSIYGKYPSLMNFASDTVDQVLLLEDLMNYPPLSEIYKFIYLVQQKSQRFMDVIGLCFDEAELRLEGAPLPLVYRHSYAVLPQAVAEELNIDSLLEDPSFSDHKKRLLEFKQILDKNPEVQIKSAVICPHCGEYHPGLTIDGKIILYKLLFENREVALAIAFSKIEKCLELLRQELVDQIRTIPDNINHVPHPECFILVEGESEHISIPILALGIGRSLKDHKVKVFNSGTKEKLAEDFKKFKKQNKTTPIIALFDSDAKKEIDEINRVIAGKKNLYRVFPIENGTYEDLFDLDTSVEALNSLYPDGDTIYSTDFDSKKQFLANVRGILSSKKKATLDKVKFAKLVAVLSVKNKRVPRILEEVVDLAEKFAVQSAKT